MSLTPVKSAPPNLNTVLQSNPGDRVSSGKGEIAPVVAILTRQLPLPQAQQLAGQIALVRVVKGGPGNEAELEFAGQNIQVKLPPGRSLTAGEMVTVSFALSSKGDDLSASGTSGSKKTQDARNLLTTLPATSEDSEVQESPSFVDKLSGTARLLGLLERLGQGSSTQVSTTVMSSLKQLSTQIQTPPQQAVLANAAADEPTLVDSKTDAGPALQQTRQIANVTTPNSNLAGVLAKQVSAAVENSGLFYESHLQQWANGQRSTDQLVREPQARFGPEQVISEKGVNPSAVEQSVKLVTAQLATLDTNRISLALSGLLGQPIHIDIEPDNENETDQTSEEQGGEPVRPWVARLKLDMAHLGELQVRVRMVASQCDVQISGSAHSKKAVDPHWQEFRQAMENRGLKLVHGQFMVPSGIKIDE
ncbi:MAG: flagellar hook-length control protein FliK [Gammaproteobacteria bacterium]|nr:flagellar hook-length control protein FliK [Gammaproteobacteria bacterium]MBU0848335.1 flagellar hook-length control protein FliK [Gammaproteobacteria bacterium]MBU1267028.1 flagellar hook-length control protein FliK [Gammaproteobacteria bacterium]MBU1529531.1 flagellar hook-length control protein FliK [Gammaproteobacteria bacterium]MBU1781112.1 flagellar hook-length control protein FliK [Gammaproteobacteria bacterium]